MRKKSTTNTNVIILAFKDANGKKKEEKRRKLKPSRHSIISLAYPLSRNYRTPENSREIRTTVAGAHRRRITDHLKTGGISTAARFAKGENFQCHVSHHHFRPLIRLLVDAEL